MASNKHNAANERIKHRYFAYLREAQGYSETTIDAAAKALDRFEIDTGLRDFGMFHHQQAVSFKRHLAEQKNERTSSLLSKATLYSTFGHLRQFFIWLAGQPGFRSRITYSDAEYFNLSDKDCHIATARREPKGPTIEQVRHVLSHMPAETDVELRNRALIAFTFLTGARDRAMASMKLKHIDVSAGIVFQDAREVRTKNSKTFKTWFFPVDVKIRAIVVDWVNFLRMRYGDDDPLFPATSITLGPTQRFEAAGLGRKHWSTTAPIRAIFRSAFAHAGLPYFNPHSFRNTLVRLGMDVCRCPAEFKAWSQNLGHEGVMTTFRSYGDVPSSQQEAIIRGLASPRATPDTVDTEAIAEAVARKLRALRCSVGS